MYENISDLFSLIFEYIHDGIFCYFGGTVLAKCYVFFLPMIIALGAFVVHRILKIILRSVYG